MLKPEISFARLVDWIEGSLSAVEADQVAAQVGRGDRSMLETVDWLRKFYTLSRRTVLVPSHAMDTQLVERFRGWASNRQQPSNWQRLVATLQFDSQNQLARAGARAVDLNRSARQLIFNSAVGDISLYIRPRAHDAFLDINGQIFPSNEQQFSALTINLLQGNLQFGLTAADDLHEFEFERVPAGTYQMTLHTEQCEILVSPIELSALA